MINHEDRKIGKRAYPLRKVVQRGLKGKYMGMIFAKLNLLECGHMVPPSRDIYGEIAGVSQRCRLCNDEKQKVL